MAVGIIVLMSVWALALVALLVSLARRVAGVICCNVVGTGVGLDSSLPGSLLSVL